MRAVVTGAGGFIGSHLTTYLKKLRHFVRGVDIHEPTFAESTADEFWKVDLRKPSFVEAALSDDIDWVFALAAYRGGMGTIADPNAQIRMFEGNIRINMNTLNAAKTYAVRKLFYASSACVYPNYRQTTVSTVPLREEDAWPAAPQGMYGLEKLVVEELALCYKDQHDLDVKIVRFHNTYGPGSIFWDGREKVIDAACRKIATAKITGDHAIEVWGDGKATRSYLYVDDNVEGIYRMMLSDHTGPLNLGRDRMVSVDDIYDMVADRAGIKIEKVYDLTKPQGVRGRNSDNSRLRDALGWEPTITVEEGVSRTYPWVEEQVRCRLGR